MMTSAQPTRKRVLAVLTIAFTSVALTGCSLLGNIVDGTANGSSAKPEGATTDVFTIKVGDCLNDGDLTGEVSDVPVINCASLHDSEAYKSIIMTDGSYPGDQAVLDQADSACSSAFTSFVGLAIDSSKLDFSYYHPTEATWSEGDREILCTVYNPDGKSTGTLKGAAI